MADSVGGDMIRGHIDSIILNSLLDGDKDTNQIRNEIEKKAGGNFKLKQGTFYSALQRISKQGFVTEYRTSGSDGVRRKFFQLTEKGKAHIEKSQTSWSESQTVINRLLDAEQPVSSDKAASVVVEEYKIPSFDEPKSITDFSELSNIDTEEPSAAEMLIYGQDDETEDSASVTTSETDNNGDASSQDSEVGELLGVLAQKDAEDAEKESEAIPVSTFIYFDNSHDGPKKDDFSDSVLLEDGINPVTEAYNDSQNTESESIKTAEIFAETLKDSEYEPLYNSDISTDSFNDRKSADDIQPTTSSVEAVETKTETTCVDKTEESSAVLSPQKINVEDADKKDVSSEAHHIENNKKDDFAGSVSEPNGEHKYEQLRIEEPVQVDPNEPDDYLTINDIPDQREYKDVLAQIFNSTKHKETKSYDYAERYSEKKSIPESPVENEKIIEFPGSKISEPNSKNDEEGQPVARAESRDDDKVVASNVIVDELDISFNDNRNSSNKDKKSKGGFDYSDIISMSEEEGFKVSTSDRTNKTELGRILINKLNFHSSLIFFFIVLIETLVVGLTMDRVLNFGFLPYFLFCLVVFIAPVVCTVSYFIAPKRVVAEVRPFKSSFETMLIITLNMLIAILVISVAFNVDLKSYADVAKFILIPGLIAINVPLFTVVKHSLLDRQMYYS